MIATSQELSSEFVATADSFANLSDRLLVASREMISHGTPPDDSLAEELVRLQSRFASLRTGAGLAANQLGMDVPAPESLSNLNHLRSFLEALGEAEARQAARMALVWKALDVIDQVLALRHISREGFEPLEACQNEARALRAAIVANPDDGVVGQVEALAGRDHPCCDLIALIGGERELSDTEWESLFESVSTAFGTTLAAAGARGKLKSAPAVRSEQVPADMHAIAIEADDSGEIETEDEAVSFPGMGEPKVIENSPKDLEMLEEPEPVYASLTSDALLTSMVVEVYPHLSHAPRGISSFVPAPKLGRASRALRHQGNDRSETVRVH